MNHHISQVDIVSFQVNLDNNDLLLASGGEPVMKPEMENLYHISKFQFRNSKGNSFRDCREASTQSLQLPC